MGYQVTARKWRPQTFDDVIEQQHVTRTLKNAIRLGRIAHAYLFAGTRGVGKTTMARVLAKALNCEQGPTDQPCGVCPSCLDITQGTALDIIEIDGASNRGIDEIRDLREHLRYLPARGRYKVYILDEIHMLTKEAFNALLKTLEEPPAHVVFVFATTELDKIPQTIRSRCQQFEFKRVSLTGLTTQLAHIAHSDGITISRTSLLRITKAAEGSMRDAQSLLDQVVAYCGMQVHDEDVSAILGHVGSETLAQCLQALLQQDASTALHAVEQLQAEGHEAAGIARALLEGLRHLMVLKTVPKADSLVPLAEGDLATLRAVADLASIEEIYGHFHVLSAAENNMRHASQPFLGLEMALVRMACIGQVQPLHTILEQLQQQESHTPARAAPAGSPPPPLPRPREEKRPVPRPVPTPPEHTRPEHGAVARNGTTTPDKVKVSQAAALPDRAEVPQAAAPDVPSQAQPCETPEPAENFWETLQQRVAERRPSLAAFLEPGSLLAHDTQKLVVGFMRRDNFCRTSLLEPDNLQVIREVAQSLVGHPIQVTIAALDEHGSIEASGTPDTKSAMQPDIGAKEELQRKKNELKQAVIDIFGATPV